MYNLYMGKFVDWLSEMLKERGMSQRELAKRGRISHSTINRILKGKQDILPGTCAAIAQGFGLPVADVLTIAGLGKHTDAPIYIEAKVIEILDVVRELDTEKQDYVLHLAKMVKDGLITVIPKEE